MKGLIYMIFNQNFKIVLVIGNNFTEDGCESIIEICTGVGMETDLRLGELVLRGLILQEK